MTIIYLLLIAVSVFMYTITAIVLSQEVSLLVVEATGIESLGTLTSFGTGLILIVGIGFLIVRYVLSRFTKL
ncbi:MAG: hypothetical protein FJ212_01140 [Ignavibacteria bacterium]|nr:hypothetical protein [Ignavibacteria bacterium]